MTYPSPLLLLHRESGALVAPYGSPIRGHAIELVEAIEPVEIEYAALRSHAAIMDRPERAVVCVTGPDRLEFLNRMLTQELLGHKSGGGGKRLTPFTTTRSFWLSRKGRIDADLRLIALQDRLLIDLDVHALDRLLSGNDRSSGLPSYVFSEDVAFEDLTPVLHRLTLLGPAAPALLGSLSSHADGPRLDALESDQACSIRLGSVDVVVDRYDSAGEIGLELLVPAEHAASVYTALSLPPRYPRPGHAETTRGPSRQPALAKRIGWHAYNIARIEAGTALFNLDFGPTTLPHETGSETLADRVSFKKGCYLGQEVVARMESLGHPKQRLAALFIEGQLPTPAPSPNPFLSERAEVQTGSPVVDGDSPTAATVGAVTSATPSPMLGSWAATGNHFKSIAFAMIKWSHATPDTRLFIQTDGHRLPASVQHSLTFWRKPPVVRA